MQPDYDSYFRYKNWLAALGPGDQVVVRWSNSPRDTPGVLRKVERGTATQVVVDGTRYSRKDGYVLGAKRNRAYTFTTLAEPTPEKLALIRRALVPRVKIRRAQVLAICKHYEWERLSDSALEEIYKLLVREGR